MKVISLFTPLKIDIKREVADRLLGYVYIKDQRRITDHQHQKTILRFDGPDENTITRIETDCDDKELYRLLGDLRPGLTKKLIEAFGLDPEAMRTQPISVLTTRGMMNEFLARLMRSLGYKAGGEGICYGYAYMAMKAFILGEFDVFLKRLRLMEGISDLKRKIEEVKRKKKEERTPDDYAVLDILAFLDGLELYSSGNEYNELFLKQQSTQDASRVMPLVVSEKIIKQYTSASNAAEAMELAGGGQEIGVREADNWTGVYTEQDLVRYLEILHRHFLSYSYPIALVLHNYHHSIMLGYTKDPVQHWIFVDANAVIYRGTAMETARGIFRGFESRNVAIILSQVYLPAPYQGKFHTHYHDDPAWKALHTITRERASAQDARGVNWLYVAAENGEDSTVKTLIGSGAMVNNIILDSGATPLSNAAEWGRTGAVKILLESRAEVNHLVRDGKTALYQAAENGHLETVKLLLAFGAEVDRTGCDDDSTPLHAAARNGHVEVVKVLLDYGAVIHWTLKNTATPLFLAATAGHAGVVRLLLERGAMVNRGEMMNDMTPLHAAAHLGHRDVMEVLLLAGAMTDLVVKKGSTPLYMAAERGNAREIELLLSFGARVDKTERIDRFTPLHMAALCGYSDAVEVLLRHGASINALTLSGSTALYKAAKKGHVRVVELLLAFRADLNKTGRYDGATPLHAAAKQGHAEVVAVLLQAGAWIDQGMKNGLTPLHVAAQNGRLSVVQLLVRNGANVNHRTNDHHGATTLSLAVEKGHLEVVRALLASGADVNCATRDNGETPLIKAVREGHIHLVRLLLESGANVDQARHDNGLTPLIAAVLNNNAEMVRLLVSHHADTQKAIRGGLTPLRIAGAIGNQEIVAMLVAPGPASRPPLRP